VSCIILIKAYILDISTIPDTQNQIKVIGIYNKLSSIDLSNAISGLLIALNIFLGEGTKAL
jgi:hypothetical protein